MSGISQGADLSDSTNAAAMARIRKDGTVKEDVMSTSNGTAGWKDREISRRHLLRAAAGGVAGAAGLAVAACGGGNGESGAAATAVATAEGGGVSPQLDSIDQHKWTRIRTGLTAWDATQAFEGYTVFAANLGSSLYLLNMRGEVVHQWDVVTDPTSRRKVRYAYLLDNGNLFVHIALPTGDAPLYVFKGGVMLEIDWDGNVVWELEDPAQHHDARMLPNGNLLILRVEQVPDDVAARVQGGRLEEADGIWADWVSETTRDGEDVWEWHVWEHLDPETHPVHDQERRNDWTHGNSARLMPDGRLLISMRNTSTVATVDRESGDIVWEMGWPQLAQQHDASPLEDGNVLIFDNGANRAEGLPFSRILEVNPGNGRIEWEYRDQAFLDFHSAVISGAQRLPNGNTLINDGVSGRLFEVTDDKRIVWEYISPFLSDQGALGASNGIYRAYRYAPERFPQLS